MHDVLPPDPADGWLLVRVLAAAGGPCLLTVPVQRDHGRMPARRTGAPDPDADDLPRLRVPREQLEAEIDERVASGEALLRMPVRSEAELGEARSAYYTWSEYNETLLRRSFDRTGPAEEYHGSRFGFAAAGLPLETMAAHLRRDIDAKLRRLGSQRTRLSLYKEETLDMNRAGSDLAGRVGGEDVFIVHGHAAGVKETVARFVRRLLNREPVILHEQPDGGRTIIEKFEAHAATAAAAIVLLTGDDVGGPQDSPPAELKPRGRQNVILELGYFLGVLGRSRVIVLYEPGVEVPSDLDGYLRVPLDTADGWRARLARELKNGANLDIDPTALL